MPHIEYHTKSSDLIADIVIGISDGLTVPFALTAGLSAAIAANNLVITAGLAEIAAGSIAMALGGYLAGRTEIDHYASEKAREYREVVEVPEIEKEEVRMVFKDMGLSAHLQREIADELSKDQHKWVDFMMRFELGLEQPDEQRAYKSAFNIGLSYIVGGLIPLSPYFFTAHPLEGLPYSVGITFICLLLFGWFKSKMTGQPLLKGALKTAAIGMIAAGAAFGIAKLIS